jgi:hypothetical protein
MAAPSKLGRLLGFDDEEGFAAVYSRKQRRAVTASVDARGDDRVAPRSVASAVEPDLDIFDVAFTERGVAGAQSRSEHGVRFGHASEDRVIAGAAVIARIAARQRPLVAEDWRDGGVGVDGDSLRLALA